MCCAKLSFVWASHKEKAGFELFEENNALATVDTGKEDQYGTRGD